MAYYDRKKANSALFSSPRPRYGYFTTTYGAVELSHVKDFFLRQGVGEPRLEICPIEENLSDPLPAGEWHGMAVVEPPVPLLLVVVNEWTAEKRGSQPEESEEHIWYYWNRIEVKVVKATMGEYVALAKRLHSWADDRVSEAMAAGIKLNTAGEAEITNWRLGFTDAESNVLKSRPMIYDAWYRDYDSDVATPAAPRAPPQHCSLQ